MYINVLDKGFIELIDIMGNDLDPLKAARVSTANNKKVTSFDRDTKLLHYLMKNNHLSPFEHIVFKFHIKTPIFIMRQWIRHRIASVNERSGRYTKFDDDWYIPNKIRVPEKNNIQGSKFINDEKLNNKGLDIIEQSINESYKNYNELINMGVAKELARIILPTAMYTEFYWTINARSLMNFLSLRFDSHSQYEIREYAKAIMKIFKDTCPRTFEAFMKYQYKGDLNI